MLNFDIYYTPNEFLFLYASFCENTNKDENISLYQPITNQIPESYQ